jgi:geranylgeranyl diphosphate synthase type II
VSFSLSDWASGHRIRVDASLIARLDDAWPAAFREAVQYPLRTGGKRIRPLFTAAAAEAVGGSVSDDIVLTATAVELIHTYSLVHDDLPCMDDDAERRGKPAVHIAHGVGTALLVGDALLTEAFRTLTTTQLPAEIQVALVAELAQAAGHQGMIGGQAADVGLGGEVTEMDQLVRLHQGKTGALIRAACRMGGLAAGASPAQLDVITCYGEAVGLAFQMADDVLDAEEDSGEDGPPSFVKLMGIEQTQRRAAELLGQALGAAASLPHPTALRALARFTVERNH